MIRTHENLPCSHQDITHTESNVVPSADVNSADTGVGGQAVEGTIEDGVDVSSVEVRTCQDPTTCDKPEDAPNLENYGDEATWKRCKALPASDLGKVRAFFLVNPSSGGKLGSKYLALRQDWPCFTFSLDEYKPDSFAGGGVVKCAATDISSAPSASPFVATPKTTSGPTTPGIFFSLPDLPEKLFAMFNIIAEGKRIWPHVAAHARADTNKLRLVAAGGDGTVSGILASLGSNEATRGLSTDEYTFAIIALGTGNDFSRTFGWGPGRDVGRIEEQKLLPYLDDELATIPHDIWQVALSGPAPGPEFPSHCSKGGTGFGDRFESIGKDSFKSSM